MTWTVLQYSSVVQGTDIFHTGTCVGNLFCPFNMSDSTFREKWNTPHHRHRRDSQSLCCLHLLCEENPGHVFPALRLTVTFQISWRCTWGSCRKLLHPGMSCCWKSVGSAANGKLWNRNHWNKWRFASNTVSTQILNSSLLSYDRNFNMLFNLKM